MLFVSFSQLTNVKEASRAEMDLFLKQFLLYVLKFPNLQSFKKYLRLIYESSSGGLFIKISFVFGKMLGKF